MHPIALALRVAHAALLLAAIALVTWDRAPRATRPLVAVALGAALASAVAEIASALHA